MTSSRILSQYFAFLSIALIILVGGCSSDDSTTPIVSDPTDPADPTDPSPPTVTAPANLAGIWEGTFKKDLDTFDVAMVFHIPSGAVEGRVIGVAINRITQEPYILIDSGYQDVTNDNWPFQYIVGRLGSQGTSLKYYEFANNLVGNQAGTIQLDLNGNTLTGTATLNILGEFIVELTYSEQNLKNATLAELEGVWTDANNGWDDGATGTTLTLAADGTVSAQAIGTSNCAGNGPSTDVTDFNIYLFGNPDQANKTIITLSGCGTRDYNLGSGAVDGFYDGMAVILEDNNGTDTLVLLMSETGATGLPAAPPSMATYNVFIKN
ncbi:MAG: hypothetical protein JSW45_02680 [Thiotrichales bacterium]|nr:MAG: hypothetical protein JSW45_02680 [Thiotrichales bacterium]